MNLFAKKMTTSYKGNGFVCEEYKDICDGVTCDDNAHTKQVTVYGTTTCKCECDSGFSGNGHTCIPDSACSGNDCSKDAVCSSNPYTGFTCTCKEGQISGENVAFTLS